MEKSRKRGLSGFALKYIAMISMICDHANLLVIRRGVYAPYTAADGSILIPADAPAGILLAQQVYRVFEILGHLGFPIFIFLLTEGFLHTRSRKRYLLTLAAFAVLTEPVYDLAHYGVLWNPALQNVLVTLTVSAALLWVLDGLERRYGDAPGKRWGLTAAAVVLAGGLALLLRGEYVFLGTTTAALLWLLRSRGVWRLVGLAPLLAVSPWCALAGPVLALYSGERGRRGWKYFFYVFYPTHFLVLLWIGKWMAAR